VCGIATIKLFINTSIFDGSPVVCFFYLRQCASQAIELKVFDGTMQSPLIVQPPIDRKLNLKSTICLDMNGIWHKMLDVLVGVIWLVAKCDS